jgi:hypothetical protein
MFDLEHPSVVAHELGEANRRLAREVGLRTYQRWISGRNGEDFVFEEPEVSTASPAA